MANASGSNWTELFRYDPDSGKLFWKITRSNRAVAGTEAGTIDKDGYRVINVGGKINKAHRIVWDILNPDNKVLCDEEIDHINHVRDDNRGINLRKVNSSGNRKNTSITTRNNSGVVGVSWCATKCRWRAFIKVGYKFKHLGYFRNFEDAVVARKLAEKHYGFHQNHGTI